MVLFPALVSMPGWGEWLVILVIVLVIFGPRRLPEIAEAMGKSIRKFKAATRDAGNEVKRELDSAGREVRDAQKDAPQDGTPTDPKNHS